MTLSYVSRGVILVDRQECKVCKLIRFYLLLALPLIAMVGLSVNGPTSDPVEVPWFARVALIDFLAYGSAAALVGVIAYRAYHEYVLPRRRARILSKLREKSSKEESAD